MDPVTAPLGQKLAWRLEALGYDLVSGLLRLLPVDAASAFGGWLLQALGPLTSVHKTVERNLRLAFPHMDKAERDRIAHAQWGSVGRYFAEFTMMDRLTPATGRVEVVGWDRLKAIAEHGPPVVFVSGHLSNFEIMPSVILAAGVACVITGRAANNPYFNEAMIKSRRRYGVRMFAPKSADGTREMLQAMDRGESVALMNDQKNNRGIAAPFFGHLAHTASGPTKLALRAGGVLQPMSVQRLKGARFRVVAHEPILLQKTGDRKADVEAGVRQINAFVEARVRERPEEWFWVHKRWADAAYASLKD
ncbi:MAG TPA: lysophospholipid acyltransferase family protein [Caulobacteraceae bacterium]